MRAFKSSAILGLCLTTALASAPVMGADARSSGAMPLTKEQLAKLAALGKTYDPPILDALKADPKLKAAMETDLKAIVAIKDTAARNGAINSYQAKYRDSYRKVLANAKIDLAAIAAKLKSIVPLMNFTVQDGTHIVGTVVFDSSKPTGIARIAEVKSLSGADFKFSKDDSCSGIGGSASGHSDLSMSSLASALDAGGCNSDGHLIYDLTVPADKKARVEMTGDLAGGAGALGLFGIAVSFSETTMVVNTGATRLASVGADCAAAAPFFWVDSVSCGEPNSQLAIDLEQAGTYRVSGNTSASAIAGGVVAGTSASSVLDLHNVKITLQPR